MKKKFIRKYHKKRRQMVKKSRFFLKHPLLFPTVLFISLFFVGMYAIVFFGSSTQGASDARIVNVYVDGEQRTVTTRAKTIGDLIERLNISLLPEDLTEPAKDALILENDTQVNIYRARPVEVIDSGRTITLLTAQRAPRLVAADAGLDLYPEDEVSFERADATVLESSASEQLLVKRSVEVTFNVYGAIKSFRTTASTVAELLEREGITVQDGETLEPSSESPISSGLLISVNRVGVKTAVVTEPIGFATEIKDDAELEAGKSRVDQAGVLGERAVVYEITETDGIETARKEIQSVVTREPVTEIRARGTKIIAPSFNPSVTVSGDKASLMAAAGIAESDFGYVDFIVSKESGWRPGAANAYSGAYGLCQSLPASKMASAGADYLTNPVTQLRWCSGYAAGRYGGWAGAYSAWLVQSWW